MISYIALAILAGLMAHTRGRDKIRTGAEVVVVIAVIYFAEWVYDAVTPTPPTPCQYTITVDGGTMSRWAECGQSVEDVFAVPEEA